MAGSACNERKTSGSGSVSTPSTYVQPTLESISPTQGGDVGGTTVTLTGTNFMSGATVTFGGVAATNVSVASTTELTCVTASHDSGTVDVVVTQGAYSSTLSGGFSYLATVDATMVFYVYRHTDGLMGMFTQTAESGTTVSIPVVAMGEILKSSKATRTALGKTFTADDVDAQHIVVREHSTSGLMGAWVSSSSNGTATFNAPFTTVAYYDVFLMDTRNGAVYTKADAVIVPYALSTTVSRGADVGGAVGPDSAIDNMVKQLDKALVYPWMRYGKIARADVDGNIFAIFAEPNGGSCVTYTRTRGMLYASPKNCAAQSLDFKAALLAGGFEISTGLSGVAPSDSSGAVDWATATVTLAGRDLYAYVYLKDSKAW
jgi:hypothetical protein